VCNLPLAEFLEQVGVMLKFKGPIWGLAGFVLGAVLSVGAAGVSGHSASTSPSPSFDKPQDQAPVDNANTSPLLPQRIVASFAKTEEVEAAIATFPVGAQRKIRKEVAAGKYRLAWLTLWDWDTAAGEIGNTISILTNDYRRYVTLNEHRTRIAIPAPRSGYIEMRGEVSEDDQISISLLSGTQPIALPTMSPGQAVKLGIVVSEPVTVSANGNATFSPPLPPDVY
jgi:hypothetical protein